MKKVIYFIVFILALAFTQTLKAQVGVSIRILPPYPNRITDYESRPQQVLITLTNQSAGTQQIQLRAAVVGDNGIRLEVGRNYKSSAAITLAPGQVRNLNGADLVTLFDYNQLTYTGITKDEFIRGNGLPEGSYQVCMQAYDYNTNAPISADEPVGCSNRFSISSLEPPLVIKPLDGEELKSTVGNIFTINWTTPPGAPPSIRYKVRIIETQANRNPNDAYLTAVPSYFFEKEVMGNVYVYNPADPQLTAGRRYVLAVTAFDPNNGYTFRNNGISQVSSFIYNSAATSFTETKSEETRSSPKKPMTTNSIKGKALWAFKASEDSYKGVTPNNSGGSGGNLLFTPGFTDVAAALKMPDGYATAGLITATTTTSQPGSANNSNASVGKGVIGGIVYNAFNPLTDNPSNVRNAITTDKTIIAAAANNGYVSAVTANANASVSSAVFVTGHRKLDSGVDASSGIASSDKKLLAGATVKIIGVPNTTPAILNPYNAAVQKEQEKQKEQTNSQFGIFSSKNSKAVTPGSQKDSKNTNEPVSGKKNEVNFTIKNLEPNLIASGKTDAEGNFDVNFADLNFTGGDRYSQIKIVVSKGAIEETKTIPVSMLKNTDIDLGEIICLASTYRFSPVIELPQIQGSENDKKNIVVKIYREDADAIAYPFLNDDGNLSSDRKVKETVNGKSMVLVAVDSVAARSGASFKFAKLFHSINYTVKLSTGGNITSTSGGLKVADVELSNTQVVNVKPTYQLIALPPAIIGSVQLSLQNGFASVKDAIVKVVFNKDDVEESTVQGSPFVSVGASQYSSQLVAGISIANTNVQASKPAQTIATTKSTSTGNFYTSNLVNSTLGGGKNTLAANIGTSFPGGNGIDRMIVDMAYTSRTDSAGNYAIGNLPRLKEGKSFTVKLIQVPAEFKNLKIDPSNEIIVNRVLDGEQKDVSFRIKPELVQVAGRVVAEDKKALGNARLNFEGSTDIFTSGETGLFSTTYFPGTHYLIIKKEGYVDERIQVIIPAKSTGNNSGNGTAGNSVQLPGNVLESAHIFKNDKIYEDTRAVNLKNTQANAVDLSIQLMNTTTVKNELARGTTFSPVLFGVAASQSVASINNSGIKSFSSPVAPTVTNVSGSGAKLVNYSSSNFSSTANLNSNVVGALSELFDNTLTGSNYGSNTLTTLDLGDVGFLKRKLGKIRFKITDAETNGVIANAQIKLFDTTGVTDNKGEWFYVGFGGDAKVSVTAPAGSAYVMVEESLLINENGSELPKTIKLQKGIKVSGFVRNNNSAVSGATVKVEEKPYLLTTTDATGGYSLYLPKGSFQLKASKSGYIAKTETVNTNSGAVQKDFALADGGGRNIAKILGFEVELDKMVQEGNGYRVSGAFVNLIPSLSDLKAIGNIKLQFSNAKINFDANNNAVPEGNKIVTDELSLSFKLLNFIPVAIKSQNGIIVESDGNGGGKVIGEVEANMTAIQGSRGWSLINAAVKLVPENVTASSAVTLFSSAGTAQTAIKYKIKGPQAGWQGSVYGFKFLAQTEQSFIDKDGLHFVGEIHTPDLGPIKSSVFKIEEFVIGSDLSVKRVKVSQTNLPTIKILDWSATLASFLFNEDGFKIGGKMVIKVPASGSSNIDFSDVSISRDMFFGGKFIIPESGINIFNIVNLKKGAAPISFGQVPNQSGVYKLGGSGKIKFTKFFTSEINIPIFEVHTNGRFLVDAPVNFESDLTFAKIKVQAIKFDNTGGTPLIGIKGALSVDVPLLSLSAADISFKNSGGGVSVSVGKIKASLDVPVLKTEIEVAMNDKGFEGGGKLGIPGTTIDAAIKFHYKKVNSGIDFGASFDANVSIPIGFVTIEGVGGGFRYNTATKDFMVDINGALSIANLGTAIKLDPIGLTVRSGPIFEGYGTVVIGTALNVAQARMKLDFPEATFSIAIDAQIEPIKGLAKAKIQGDLIISLKNDDRFAFLGCSMEANLLGLIKSNGEFALGVGVKNPSTRGDRVSHYFQNVDTRYVKDVFSGIYVNTYSKMGIPKDKPLEFKVLIASLKFWYSTEASAKLIFNFAENSYLIGVAGNMGGGFEACLLFCVGINYQAGFEFMGGRNEADGWFFSGKAHGRIECRLGGCNPSCNDVDFGVLCGMGVKLCAGGGAKITFKEKAAKKLDLSFYVDL